VSRSVFARGGGGSTLAEIATGEGSWSVEDTTYHQAGKRALRR
jgi:hypothetical protein